jgi:hypothetical protein
VTVAEKLQIKPGQSVAFLGDRRHVTLDLDPGNANSDDPAAADAVIAFAADSAALDRLRGAIVGAATRGVLAWVAYPKAGQLGTDSNRDRVRDLLMADEIRPVRQVAIDEVWSALRFRPR